MTNWDTRALHREACDAFTTLSTLAEEGKRLLDEIAAIAECLKRMDDLKEFRISSVNDCTWSPPVSKEEIQNFVVVTLEKRRNELRAKFNAIKLPGRL